MSDAQVLVWDPATGRVLEDIGCDIRAVVSDDENRVVYELSPDLTISPRWAGMAISVEVSPKAVTGDPLTRAVADVAKRMGVPVG